MAHLLRQFIDHRIQINFLPLLASGIEHTVFVSFGTFTLVKLLFASVSCFFLFSFSRFIVHIHIDPSNIFHDSQHKLESCPAANRFVKNQKITYCHGSMHMNQIFNSVDDDVNDHHLCHFIRSTLQLESEENFIFYIHILSAPGLIDQ